MTTEAERNLKIHNLMRWSLVAGVVALVILVAGVINDNGFLLVFAFMAAASSALYAWSAKKLMDGSAN